MIIKNELIKLILVCLFATTFTWGVTFTHSASANSSSNFQMDFNGVNTGSKNSKSPSFEIQGGLVPIQTNSGSSSFQISTINLIPTCGNGIIELNETCDSSMFNGLTCSDYGFNSGVLTCLSCAEISASACFNSSAPIEDPTSVPPGGLVYWPSVTKKTDNIVQEFSGEEDERDSDPDIEGSDDRMEEPSLIEKDEFVEIIESEKAGIGDLKPYPESKITPVVVKGVSVITEKSAEEPEDSTYEHPEVIQKTVDATPVIVELLEPNVKYILIIENFKTGEVVFQTEVLTDTEGNIVFEITKTLEFGVYRYVFKDMKEIIGKSGLIEVIQKKYPEIVIENFAGILDLDSEYAKEVKIYLGDIIKREGMKIIGKTAPNTTVDSYFQSELIKVSAFSDELGDFIIPIPDSLGLGEHSLTIVQKYPDGTYSDDLQFAFNLIAEKAVDTSPPEIPCVNGYIMFLFLFIIFLFVATCLYFGANYKKVSTVKTRGKNLSK